MNRLCLIKPWHLPIIHQRLEAAHSEYAISSTVPCSGPSGECIEVTDIRKDKEAFSLNKPSHAPFSDVIFASGNNNIR